MFNCYIKVNIKQKSILFDAMARNRYKAGRQTSDGMRDDSYDWATLAAELNMHGPKKSTKQWKKCWRDLQLATRKRFLKSKKGNVSRLVLNEIERLAIRACGIDMELDKIEEVEICKEELADSVPSEFEVVHILPDEITSDHELMKDTIQIEDSTEHFKTSESEYLFLSGESPMHELHSMCNAPPTPADQLSTNVQSETLIEIRKMHRNLLRESRLQSKLLMKLLNRLRE